MMRITLILMTVVGLVTGALSAERGILVKPVQFERGTNSTTIESSIAGYTIVDYVLGARHGQYMNASMANDNGANYFNILAPGENQVAMFNGSINGNQYEGILPESGDYKVMVYVMRSAARRNEVANYRLEIIITAIDDKAEASGSADTFTDLQFVLGKVISMLTSDPLYSKGRPTVPTPAKPIAMENSRQYARTT